MSNPLIYPQTEIEIYDNYSIEDNIRFMIHNTIILGLRWYDDHGFTIIAQPYFSITDETAYLKLSLVFHSLSFGFQAINNAQMYTYN